MIFDKPTIAANDINEIASKYDFGAVTGFANLGGIPNNTFKIFGEKKTFVVRIYSIGQSDIKHIEEEINILNYLSKHNFISPIPEVFRLF